MEAATAPPAAPDHPGESPDEQPIPDVELEGDGQLTLGVGGEKPTKATVKLRNRSIGIPVGQYQKGDVVDLLLTVRCDVVALIDKHDESTGQITEIERRHGFSVTNVERVR